MNISPVKKRNSNESVLTIVTINSANTTSI